MLGIWTDQSRNWNFGILLISSRATKELIALLRNVGKHSDALEMNAILRLSDIVCRSHHGNDQINFDQSFSTDADPFDFLIAQWLSWNIKFDYYILVI